MIKQIEYENKQAIQNDDSIANKNKVTAEDMNEIKNVVNQNAKELEILQEDNQGNETAIETLQNDISLIKQNNSEQDKSIQSNTGKIEAINKSLEAINKKNTEQDTNLQKNAKDIEVNQNNIKALQVENAEVKAENERLRSDIESISLLGEAEGESIDLDDSSGARFKKFGVGGNHSQETREGYNLLDMRNAKGGTSNGITCEINADGSVKYTGTATSNAINVFFLGTYGENAATLFTLKPGTYYIKDVNLYNKTIGINPTKNKYIWTIEEETNVTAVRAPQADTGKTYNETIYPIVSLSNKAADYEQYGATPSLDFPSEIKTVKDNANVVVCNKNLFDKNNATVVEFFVDGENKIQSWTNEVESIYIPIKSNTTYTVSKKISSRFTVATSNKVPVVGVEVNAVSNRTASNLTITSRDGDKYLLIFYYKKSDDTLNAKEIRDSIQIEKGSTATDFVEHQEQAITIPTQQEMLQGDYFDWVNEKEVHTWCKEICNGTEKWIQQQTTSAGYWYIHDVGGKGITLGNPQDILCNKLKGINPNEAWNGTKDGINVSNNINIYLKEYSQNKTLDDFKKMLSENPLEIYYKVKTQIELPFTDEQKAVAKQIPFTDEQKAVAKQIKETLHTYKNITHIYSTDETNPIMNVEYAKDLNTQNNNLQNQIDEIKQLISTTQTSAMLLDNLQKEVESEVE